MTNVFLQEKRSEVMRKVKSKRKLVCNKNLGIEIKKGGFAGKLKPALI